MVTERMQRGVRAGRAQVVLKLKSPGGENLKTSGAKQSFQCFELRAGRHMLGSGTVTGYGRLESTVAITHRSPLPFHHMPRAGGGAAAAVPSPQRTPRRLRGRAGSQRWVHDGLLRRPCPVPVRGIIL